MDLDGLQPRIASSVTATNNGAVNKVRLRVRPGSRVRVRASVFDSLHSRSRRLTRRVERAILARLLLTLTVVVPIRFSFQGAKAKTHIP